jgi:hypothetical protein
VAVEAKDWQVVLAFQDKVIQEAQVDQVLITLLVAVVVLVVLVNLHLVTTKQG